MGTPKIQMKLATYTNPNSLQEHLKKWRREGKKIAFVPTMGALHEGHLALVSHAKTLADVVVVSIFVNPTQFGPKEDFAKYPRDLESDLVKLASVKTDILFAPSAEDMYPKGDQTRVNLSSLSAHLCGPFRPGHFEGVATVVLKFFGMVGECVAIFGRKDYQQFALIKQMASDLFLDTEVVGMTTVREVDGLAMSSRNRYLSAEERKKALSLYAGLKRASDAYNSGERRIGQLRELVNSSVSPSVTSVDYIDAYDPETLVPLRSDSTERVLSEGQKMLLAIACHVGTTRLIDNLVLGEEVL